MAAWVSKKYLYTSSYISQIIRQFLTNSNDSNVLNSASENGDISKSLLRFMQFSLWDSPDTEIHLPLHTKCWD